MKKVFPPELLGQSNEDRRNYFKHKRIGHPMLKKVQAELSSKINDAQPGKMIYIFGPTGVGKSVLLTRTKENIWSAFDQEKNIGSIPVTSIEVVPPTKNSFRWDDFFIRGLQAFREPMIMNKILYPNEKEEVEGTDAGRFERAYEKCLKNRKPKAVLIDEAQHFAKMSTPNKYIDQTDILKSLANRTQVVHVFFGNYDLLDLRDLNDQLVRRGEDIHFHRYRYEIEEERKQFQGALLTLQSNLPLKGDTNLAKHWEYCYEKSIGCIGLLQQWLYNALSLALNNNEECLLKSHLEATAMRSSKIDKIIEATLDGERKFKAEEQIDDSLIREKLGMGGTSAVVISKEENQVDKEMKKEKEKPKTKPGQQKPKRRSIESEFIQTESG